MVAVAKRADSPRIRSALALYKVSSLITGVLLLLLCAEVLLKYAFHLELEMGGPKGFLAFVPTDTVVAINLSTGLLIAHGWFYVLYLFADFQLWSRMRWPFLRFLIIALGGIIPLLSFFLEVKIHREVTDYLATRDTPKTTTVTAEASH